MMPEEKPDDYREKMLKEHNISKVNYQDTMVSLIYIIMIVKMD